MILVLFFLSFHGSREKLLELTVSKVEISGLKKVPFLGCEKKRLVLKTAALQEENTFGGVCGAPDEAAPPLILAIFICYDGPLQTVLIIKYFIIISSEPKPKLKLTMAHL